jgi:excisionase family DNA binding protein
MALLTAHEVAEELGVHWNTVMRDFHRGHIPGEQIGRLVRFDLKDVREAMRQRALGRQRPARREGPPAGRGAAGGARGRPHRVIRGR